MNILTQKKSLWVAYCIASLVMLIGSVFISTELRPLHQNWHILEMLIDYSNGFARRGLLGFVLRELSFIFNDPWLTILAFMGITYIATSLIWLLIVQKGTSVLNSAELFLFLFNPILILGFTFDGTLPGKDVFLLLTTLMAVLIASSLIDRKDITSRVFVYVIIGCAGIVVSLVHEGFALFICLPALVLMLLALSSSYLLSSVVILPSLFLIGLSILNHGDASSSVATCEAWNDLLQFDCSQAGTGLGAISAMSWSFSYAVLNYSGLTMLDTGQIFWWIIPFGFWTLINIVIARKVVSHISPENQNLPDRLFFLLFIVSVPLYIIADGWGRYYTVQSAIWVGMLFAFRDGRFLTSLNHSIDTIVGLSKPLIWLDQKFTEFTARFIGHWEITRSQVFLSLIIGFPVCCITMLGLLSKGPLGAVINRTAQLFLYL